MPYPELMSVTKQAQSIQDRSKEQGTLGQGCQAASKTSRRQQMIPHSFPGECNFSSFTGYLFQVRSSKRLHPQPLLSLSKTVRSGDSTVPCELSYCCVLRPGKCLCCRGTGAMHQGWLREGSDQRGPNKLVFAEVRESLGRS